jgi:hypothetical protein
VLEVLASVCTGESISPASMRVAAHTLIVALELPARPRLHQALEERYFFVPGDLALLVSDKLVHQSHETTSELLAVTAGVHHSALAHRDLALARLPRRPNAGSSVSEKTLALGR